MDKGASRTAVAGGLLAIYLIWGSTYLGIAVGVAEIPPFLMAGLRFVPAGLLLYAWTRWRGAPAAPRQAWLRAGAAGILMLTVGNGILSFVETRMPSGIAALLVATVPLWLVLLQGLESRAAPSPRVLLAIGLGLGGVALLSGEDAGWKGGVEPLYVLLVVLASLSWAFGSLLQRRRPAGVPVTQAAALQMVVGGAVLLVLSFLRDEPSTWDPAATSWRAWAAVLYLSVFGSIVALTTYTWLFTVAPPALIGTYAFVNPVIAVLLGAVLNNEALTGRLGFAGLLIVAAVAAIVWDNARRLPRTPPPVRASTPAPPAPATPPADTK